VRARICSSGGGAGRDGGWQADGLDFGTLRRGSLSGFEKLLWGGSEKTDVTRGLRTLNDSEMAAWEDISVKSNRTGQRAKIRGLKSGQRLGMEKGPGKERQKGPSPPGKKGVPDEGENQGRTFLKDGKRHQPRERNLLFLLGTSQKLGTDESNVR